MATITFQEYIKKSGQMLEKYRSNIDHLRKLIQQIENKFFLPEEMVNFYYANKSEYSIWKDLQSNIISLEDAYLELVENMMEAISSPEDFNFLLEDGRIPILEYKDVEGDDEDEGEEESTKEE